MDLSLLRAVPLYDSYIDGAGVTELLKRAADVGAWVVFYTHDVCNVPSRVGCSPALLESAAAAATALNLEVLPVKHAAARAAFNPG